MERKMLFKALVGSHNYNLNTINSDKDYKVFVLPNLDDIYKGNLFSSEKLGEEDINIHDFRRLESLLVKSNVNFVEVLFSQDVVINNDLPGKMIQLIHELFKIREEIAKINLYYLYNACYGMYHNKMKEVHRKINSEEFPFKSASQAYRILDFLIRYKNNNFSSFKDAIYYEDKDKERLFILSIKNKNIEKELIIEKIAEKLLKVNEIENAYKHPLNEDTRAKLNNILKEIFKIHTKNLLM